MRAATLLLVVTTVGLASCTTVSGRFQGSGGPGGTWTLRPNACDANPHFLTSFASVGSVDLYWRGANAADSEILVRGSVPEPAVWVRIPGKNAMAIFRAADCRELLVSVHDAGYTINDGTVLTGRVRLDCARPEIGHVTGEATFTCN